MFSKITSLLHVLLVPLFYLFFIVFFILLLPRLKFLLLLHLCLCHVIAKILHPFLKILIVIDVSLLVFLLIFLNSRVILLQQIHDFTLFSDRILQRVIFIFLFLGKCVHHFLSLSLNLTLPLLLVLLNHLFIFFNKLQFLFDLSSLFLKSSLPCIFNHFEVIARHLHLQI